MTKDKFNAKLREYSRTLSPTTSERDLVNKIYQSFNDLFGINNCIQIGSYPRFTSVTPIHDLDILYILGAWNEANHRPSTVLQNLFNQISSSYTNPTAYTAKVSLQTHSVTVDFSRGTEVILSVDIVPAYSFGKNEFNQDTYKVPEVIKERSHAKRKEFYAKIQSEHRDMSWINSDPRGYIKIATDVGQNPDFRKAVKIVKKWKGNLCAKDESLKLKSFHLEQVMINLFQGNQNLDVFDAIFKFFYTLSNIVDGPNQIADRANNDKFIDDYLSEFTDGQKGKIKQARNGFLIQLENLRESNPVSILTEIVFHTGPISEDFIFDKQIKTLIDPSLTLKIDGFVRPLDGFSSGWLTQTPQLRQGLSRGQNKTRKIEFSIRKNTTGANSFWWKVRNSDDCGHPRGEITMNQTKNNPESTEYPGDHYVECFAVIGETCVAKAWLPIRIL